MKLEETLDFSLARLPEIHFGEGALNLVPGLASRFGKRFLLITGARSLEESGSLKPLLGAVLKSGAVFNHERVAGEPSPETVNKIVARNRRNEIEAVISIGGGSVIDAGKAVSAMLLEDAPVERFLEDVGDLAPSGKKLPFVAVPTTAGTGSEATNNAVLSRIGRGGFKKSLRHANYVPDAAVIDPSLLYTCPPQVAASSAMDALTQLLESFVSRGSSFITDRLALWGLELIRDSILQVRRLREASSGARRALALAALVSGITLNNAGLGVVHGLASSIGGAFAAPHGAICAAILAPATRVNVEFLKESDPGGPGINKYAAAGRILNRKRAGGNEECLEALSRFLVGITSELEIPGLSELGVSRDDFQGIIKETSLKNNPAFLGENELLRILEESL